MKKYLLGKIVRFIKKWHLLKGGEKVLIAISGGADSVFMTEMFFDLAPIFNIKFECIHVNHGLRGEESLKDEEFVRNYCARKDVFLTVKRLDNIDISESGVEEKARKKRYRVFYDVLRERGCDFVATAHTMDDNAETMLFNLIRGAGVSGIAGIPPLSDKVIRPILPVQRSEILNYLRAHNIEYVVDSTNTDDKYARNYIRNRVLPLFGRINPAYLKHMFQASLILRNMDEWSKSKVKELQDRILHTSESVHVFRISRETLPDIVYVNLLKTYVSSPSYEEVNQFLSLLHNEGRMGLRNVEITFNCGELAFVFGNYKLKETILGLSYIFTEYDMNYKLEIKKGKARGKMECQIDSSYFPFILRTKRAGDRIGGKKLKDRFIDLKIPYWRRRFWPVFEKNGEIFFVPGVFKKEEKEGDIKLEVKKYDAERFSIFD